MNDLIRPAHLPPPGSAVITGASSGIGAAFAWRLAAYGYRPVLIARRAGRLAELAAEIETATGQAAAVVVADLATPAGRATAAAAIADLTDLRLLINNAGFGTSGPFAAVDATVHQTMIDVHAGAAVALCHAAVPRLQAAGGGVIINVSSIAAFFTSGGSVSYNAAKAFLNRFSQTLAAEVAPAIRVQALCPGYTRTEFHDTPAFAAFDRRQVPASLWQTPQDVVDASLAALKGRSVIVIPGWRNQWLVWSSRHRRLGWPLRLAKGVVKRVFVVYRDFSNRAPSP